MSWYWEVIPVSFTARIRDGLSLVPVYFSNATNTIRNSHRRYWKDAIVNALILAGFNFFSTLAGLSVAQIITEPQKALVAAGVAAGLGFFSRLMVERGITTQPPRSTQ